MVPFVNYFGDAMQVALAAVAIVLMVVSANAYRRRSEGRYFVLALAFVCLCAASVATVVMELVVGLGPETIQLIELYLIPSLEFLMATCFLVALFWSPDVRRRLRNLLPVVVVALALVAAAAYALSPQANGASPTPAGCARPAGGFLIVASSLGYNNSLVHGAPAKSWPILDVAKGADVKIAVCNTYNWSVGFQVTYYLADQVEVVHPGQVLNINFVANQVGTFFIYCSTVNPIHIYLQGGELNVG